MRKVPQRDPVAAYGREATAARCVGEGRRCACGEARPEALIRGSDPTICAACDRKRRAQTTVDDHHVAGEANSPVTTPVPVNDHRAVLSVNQYDWPKSTRENTDRSPLLAAAAGVRGYLDTDAYLKHRFLLSNPEMLETLDAFLVEKLGPRWWVGSPLERFAPEGKPDVKS